MTSATLSRVIPVGVGLGLWEVAGAAAPTLVVASRRRLADPIPVLATAVAATGHPVRKVALAHPAAGNARVHAEYVFVQVVEMPAGLVLDLTPECGNSMLATATQLHAGAESAEVPLRLLSTRSGRRRVIDCYVRPAEAVADRYLAGLHFPLDAPEYHFPLGTEPVIAEAGGVRAPVTVIDSGNLYAFVDASALGLDANAVLTAGEPARAVLRGIRAYLAPLLGCGESQVLPKPALYARGAEGVLRVRALSVDGWHPGLALTGLVAAATLTSAGAADETVVTVENPGGTATVTLRASGAGHRVAVVADRLVTRLARLPSGG